MKKHGRAPSRGAVRVGLLALHDKKFFARLLKNPREAMTTAVAAGTIKLTEEDMGQVEALIRTNLAHVAGDPLVMWDRYQKLGQFADGDWQDLWKER